MSLGGSLLETLIDSKPAWQVGFSLAAGAPATKFSAFNVVRGNVGSSAQRTSHFLKLFTGTGAATKDVICRFIVLYH